MQCKPGDLAIVTNDHEFPQNNGALLRIWKPALPGECSIPADWVCLPLSTFIFSDRVVGPGDRRTVMYRDKELKPLRHDDGADQSIAWAGPSPGITEEKATAAPQAAASAEADCKSSLRATVQRVDRFVSGAWSLTLISGNVGFDVKVDSTVMPANGVQPGDRILLECTEGGHPFFGPFTSLCVENA